MYSLDDTIVAVSTPPGTAGLGVIRLSGPRSIQVAQAVFSKDISGAPTHTLHHGIIKDSGRDLDEVLLAVMRAPGTYTGEDVIEISGHGGPVLLEAVVSACLRQGARRASPGEFTFRAFCRGRLDLASAEAVCDLIESKTALASEAALRQLKGSLSKKVFSFRRELIDLLSALEAALDHAEEDIRFLSPEETVSRLNALRDGTLALIATARRGRLLRDGARVAIIGRPNTGKSSLFNALLARDRAIVTELPGTTRDIIEETLDVRGYPVVIMDTAGLREGSGDPVEKIGQERARGAAQNSDIAVFVIDGSSPLSEADQSIAAFARSLGEKTHCIAVVNKSDLPQRLAAADLSPLVTGWPCVSVSAAAGDGLPALEEAIFSCLEDKGLPPPDGPIVTSERHAAALRKTAGHLSEAVSAVQNNKTEEIVALHLREALSALGEITGETATEEILENIFSRFCVGK